MKNPLALIILDGFGIRENGFGNAIKMASLPNYDRLANNYPYTQIQASGIAVGLPEGQMGNSEVGHLNIGAGRIVYQELSRISKEIKEGSFYNNQKFLDVIFHVKTNKTKLHLLGLVSDGGVHSHIDHLYALLKLAKLHGLDEVYIHCFLDGRDTPPRSAEGYIQDLLKKMKEIGVGQIASISGRYYAMDRDKRWERTQLAYKAMVLGEGRVVEEPLDAIKTAYSLDESDEFILPSVILNHQSNPNTIENNDGLIFFNFRPDRARQITRALIERDFNEFKREKEFFPLHYVTMTLYSKTFEDVQIAYKPQTFKNTLGEYVSKQGLRQLRIAETEKYAHVTYFFNGGEEAAFIGEDRQLIPSPQVATYDTKPEMSALEVTDRLIEEIDRDKYDFIVLNFANPDMVGHTGKIDAVIKALEKVDECLGRVIEKILEKGGKAIVTSDHGNSEELIDKTSGNPVTAHTTNPVPLILIGQGHVRLRKGGKLCDIAPTILEIMGLEKPVEMTGLSLII